VVELGQVGEDRQPVRGAAGHHVRGVEEGGDPQLPLSCLKGQPAVVLHPLGVKAGKVNEVRPMMMEDSTEGKAVPPRGGHIHQPHSWVAGGHPAGPHLQSLSATHHHAESR